MNATAFEGGKVHLLRDQAARCGVGKPPKHSQWQIELGEVTCRRCVRLSSINPIQQGPRVTAPSESQGPSTTDSHR